MVLQSGWMPSAPDTSSSSNCEDIARQMVLGEPANFEAVEAMARYARDTMTPEERALLR